ncbi:hypothetical protein [Enterococcus devriesei]|uniref:hypothetical protein n=1 Tax=Enterococcus devriesei TaxID=319970 RepID=UPI0028A74354|nr:hypothetical protein [Enterococcus devriesei]
MKINKPLVIYVLSFLAFILVAIVLQPIIPTYRLFCSLLFQISVIALIVIFFVKNSQPTIQKLGLTKKDFYLIALTIGLSAVLLIGFVASYLEQEQVIKVYDFSNYWIKVIEGRKLISASIPDYLVHLRASLGTEYNDFLAFPLVFFSQFLGVSFTGFVSATLLAYYLPTCFLLTIYSLSLVQKINPLKRDWKSVSGLYLIVLLIPVFLAPVLLGYVDIGGLLFVLLLLILLDDWNLATYTQKDFLTIAFTMLLLLIARRWYAIYLTGLVLALLLTTAKQIKKTQLINTLKKIIITFIVIIILVLIINPQLIEMFIGKNYADLYSAYKTSGVVKNISEIILALGMLWFIPFFWSFPIFLVNKPTRYVTVGLVTTLVLSAGIFRYIQEIGFHHRYLVVPTIVIFIVSLIAYCSDWVRAKAGTSASGLFYSFVLLLSIFNFLGSYSQSFEYFTTSVRPFFSQNYQYPVKEPDYQNYQEINQDLKKIVGVDHSNVYPIGEGQIFSSEKLKRIGLPKEVDAAPYLLNGKIVDTRDGFPSQLFYCEYIIMAVPFSTDFTSIQQISYQPYELLLEDPLMKEYFSLYKTYRLNGSKLHLYKKRKPITRVLVDHLSKKLQAAYPDQPFVYQPNYLLSLLDVPARQTNFDYEGTKTWLYKSPDEQLTFSIHDTKSFNHLKLKISADQNNLRLVVRNQDRVIAQYGLKKAENVYPIDLAQSDQVSITIENVGGVPSEGALLTLDTTGNNLME